MTSPCFESIQVVAMRVHRLAASGAVLAGAKNAYQSAAVVNVANTFVYSTGADIEQKNGGGTLCLTYQGEDKLKGANPSVNLCQLDSQLIEMMTGWTALTDLSTNVIGLAAPAVDAANKNGVCLEAWSLAWDGNQQAVDGSSNPLYIRYFWPRVKFVVGDFTIEEGALVVPLTGKGYGNTVLTTARGPAGDWPVGAGSGPWGYFLDPSVVVPTCAYLTAPTGS
jgi:hypothetical protein